MTLFQKHRKKWIDCRRCELHKQRNRVVLVRGKLPSPILFIGEAPGASEDVLGKPFCGPAGKMLNYILEVAIDGQYDYALTNLVACIPKDERGSKIHEPPQECIKACAPRLKEIVHLCQPQLVVLVGRLAQNSGCCQARFSDKADFSLSWLPSDGFLDFCHLIHPAAILRLDVSQKGLAIQRCIVTLSDAVNELE